jgi:hypothetical protein
MTTVKYKILKGILVAGVVLGFGSGFAHLGARWARHGKDGRGHCSPASTAGPDGSRWDRKPDRPDQSDREVAPPPSPAPTATPAL